MIDKKKLIYPNILVILDKLSIALYQSKLKSHLILVIVIVILLAKCSSII